VGCGDRGTVDELHTPWIVLLASLLYVLSFSSINLLLILTTGGQLFTGNSATVAAAKFEGLVEWRELWKSWSVSLLGNIIGCAAFAVAASYVGLLTGGTADLCMSTALNKCRGSFGQTMVKAILCNWMVSLAVFLAGASNDLVGKLVGIWFPISTFVAIGLEHSVANLFIMPAALLLKIPLTLSDVLLRNVLPVIIGNAIAGAFVVWYLDLIRTSLDASESQVWRPSRRNSKRTRSARL